VLDPEVDYDASLLTPTGYWVHTEPGHWVPSLADDALRPTRRWALGVGVPPVELPQWQRDAYDVHVANDYPRLVREWLLATQTFDVVRAQARERNTAMLLWGIHL
jgi:hypothetical protein